jgi:sensory rhodopsin
MCGSASFIVGRVVAQIWLQIGVVGMTFGSLVFGYGASHASNQRWQILYTLNFFICLIAAGLYLAMSLGLGFEIIYERPTFWVRYITWFCSTPLLILDLAFLGGTNLPITCSLIGANAYMIATGFVGAITRKPMNQIWYLVSCGAFLATLYLLIKPYRNQARANHPQSKRVFDKLLTAHVVLWTLYPIVWILASTGFNILNQGYETMSYTLLDLASKVGFGFLSLNSLKQIEAQTSSQLPLVTERVKMGID